MSLINPEKLPVSVYRWDDADAPILDKSAGCVSTIFKACLVTGYGSKQGAGWSMPYEDLQAGVKVLRPPASAEQDFYLRLSADSGSQLTAQVYLTMADINTGDLKLQLGNNYLYAKPNNSGAWVLLATERGFWFLTEQYYWSNDSKYGSYFYTGDIAVMDESKTALFLAHTSGTDANIFEGVQDSNGQGAYSNFGKIYVIQTAKTLSNQVVSYFGASDKKTTMPFFSNLHIFADNICFKLLGVYSCSSSALSKNMTVVNNINAEISDIDALIFSTESSGQTNHYFAKNYWVY